MSVCIYVDFKNRTSNINLLKGHTKFQSQFNVKGKMFFIFVNVNVMVLVMVTDD